MFQILLLLVVLIPLVPALWAAIALRPANIEQRPGRWNIRRHQWLALALFDLTFAAGTSLVMAIDGEVIKYLLLILPSATLGAFFLYKAQTSHA
jgi:hypothetical protein